MRRHKAVPVFVATVLLAGASCGVAAPPGQTPAWSAAKLESVMAMPTPVAIDAEGAIELDGSGWVAARIQAVDTVPNTSLRVQFVLYESRLECRGDRSARAAPDVLCSEEITLTGPPDRVEVTRNFTFDPGKWIPERTKLVVFVEDCALEEVVSAQIVRDTYDVEFTTLNYAQEIEFWGEATFTTILRNSGSVTDTITTDIANIELPDGVGLYDWFAIYCDTEGVCYFGPHDWVMAPGQEESLFVHVTDYKGDVPGAGVTELTATSAHHRATMASEIFGTFVEVPSILTVDDDAGDTLEVYLANALKDTGYPSMVWDADARGRPTSTLLESFWAVFWTTANGSATYIGSSDEQNMTDYLAQGGNLFLASMDYLSSRTLTPPFVSDYLHVDSWTSDVGGSSVSGIPGDIVSDGMVFGLAGGPVSYAESDGIDLGVGATEIFTTGAATKGLRVEEDGHKVVFTSFPFESIAVADPAPSSQRGFVHRVVEYFMIGTGVDDGLEPEFATFALKQNVPNPFNPSTSIGFSVPTAARHVNLAVYNARGQLVKTLVDWPLGPGPNSVDWDGRGEAGSELASGIYFARLTIDGETALRKMTLLK